MGFVPDPLVDPRHLSALVSVMNSTLQLKLSAEVLRSLRLGRITMSALLDGRRMRSPS